MLKSSRNHSDNAVELPHRTLTRTLRYSTEICKISYGDPTYLAQSLFMAVILSHINYASQAQIQLSHHCMMVKTCTFTSALHGGAALKAPDQ
ncbi:hypothetical protein LSTR_LSTR012659 [Laodelphax striatellus]|uniref:Uncharacterized protein n=1 Tax=Laodelphax striatellus TaxID=195883 RepID=A0A482WG47_LAOST|nr:hypothetical protein LSTR_LSTR012659 [Laodelphax striatellus]